jgi:hypothetical protein
MDLSARLPADEGAEERSMADPSANELRTSRPAESRVLVVGGEPTLPETVAAALEITLGCRVRSGLGGAALDAACCWRPALVVADLDALRAEADPLVARVAAELPGTPVVGLRSPGWRESIGLAPVEGCAGYLDRTFELPELMSLASRLLDGCPPEPVTGRAAAPAAAEGRRRAVAPAGCARSALDRRRARRTALAGPSAA